jgi:hypothetical protein
VESRLSAGCVGVGHRMFGLAHHMDGCGYVWRWRAWRWALEGLPSLALARRVASGVSGGGVMGVAVASELLIMSRRRRPLRLRASGRRAGALIFTKYSEAF